MSDTTTNPSFSTTISSSKTIREFLNSKKTDNYIKIKIGSTETYVYNVDVIWDGGEYYIAYTTSTTGADIVIASLDSVLPITLTTTAPSA